MHQGLTDKKVMKKFPKMSRYEGAWPIRAIVAKYVAYRRNQFGIRKENEQTQEIARVCLGPITAKRNT